MHHVLRLLAALALVGELVSARPVATGSPLLEHLTIVVPAAPDGGWDQMARAMKRTLEAEGLAAMVELVHSPGAGGTIGLAEFISARRGDSTALLVTGTTMVGAILANKATVSLLETTPIARLTDEDVWVLAAPAASPIASLPALVDALHKNPAVVTFGGGSYGSPDHTLLSMFGRSIGADSLNYVPFPGGGDAARASLAGEVTLVVSGYGSVAPYVKSGSLKVIALASDRPVPGIDAPILTDGGRPIKLPNWRGVLAPPGLDPAARERLDGLIGAMVASEAWRTASKDYFWLDAYLPGEKFSSFLAEEQQRALHGVGPYAPRLLALGSTPSPQAMRAADASVTKSLAADPAMRTVALAALLVVLPATVYGWRRSRRRSRQSENQSEDLRVARAQLARESERVEALMKGLGDTIERQFDTWGLTAAEREVALLMLKGIKHKGIAEIRHTSERTARHQALAIYRKGNLDGRTDLAAYFLEDMLTPVPPDSPTN